MREKKEKEGKRGSFVWTNEKNKPWTEKCGQFN